jgi:2-oxoglutarate dehydrogenase E2 component (dihydrolipoamide succinyltransferase)
MTIDIKVPMLPESVSDAVVATWHKQAGDRVEAGDNLLDLETDKVMLEVPAPSAGVLQDILAQEGSTVESGAILGRLGEGVAADTAKVDPVQKGGAASQKENPATPADIATPSVSDTASSESVLTPSVRRAVQEHQADPSKLKATGKGGRLTRADVERGKQAAQHEEAMPIATSARQEKRVPMSRMRAKIAERLLSAKNNTAMLTTFNEINMQPVMDIRARYKDAFIKQHDVKLGFMSFFIKAVVTALQRFPAINASIDGNDIVYHDYFDVGVAISAPRGLVVPVIRDVDQMSMADIESAIIEFANKAKNNKLTIDEMTGGTFTVTNGGTFGSMMSTPLLNPPQCGILGMHNIVKRPVVENNEIVIRPMMYVALSYDHQLVDGRESVQFLVTIKELLENLERLLLDL